MSKAALTGASGSASSSNKSAFGGRLTGIRTPPQKVPLLIYGCGKLQNRTSIVKFFENRHSASRWDVAGSTSGKNAESDTPEKIPPRGVRFWRFPQPFYIEGLFSLLQVPLLEAYMAAIQSLPGLHSRWGDKNRCVTRIQGKWAFRILTQLQRGPTQLSRLRSTLPPGLTGILAVPDSL